MLLLHWERLTKRKRLSESSFPMQINSTPEATIRVITGLESFRSFVEEAGFNDQLVPKKLRVDIILHQEDLFNYLTKLLQESIHHFDAYDLDLQRFPWLLMSLNSLFDPTEVKGFPRVLQIQTSFFDRLIPVHGEDVNNVPTSSLAAWTRLQDLFVSFVIGHSEETTKRLNSEECSHLFDRDLGLCLRTSIADEANERDYPMPQTGLEKTFEDDQKDLMETLRLEELLHYNAEKRRLIANNYSTLRRKRDTYSIFNLEDVNRLHRETLTFSGGGDKISGFVKPLVDLALKLLSLGRLGDLEVPKTDMFDIRIIKPLPAANLMCVRKRDGPITQSMTLNSLYKNKIFTTRVLFNKHTDNATKRIINDDIDRSLRAWRLSN